MVETRYTHVSIQAGDLDRLVEFYETVFGLERVPTPAFAEPAQWLDCGGLQLHIVERPDAEGPPFNHHALHVDDFEAVYRGIAEFEGAEFEALPQIEPGFVDGEPPVYILPTGEVQLYIRDPAGNLVEVNAPDVEDLDRSVVPNVLDRSDVEPPAPDDPPAPIYMD